MIPITTDVNMDVSNTQMIKSIFLNEIIPNIKFNTKNLIKVSFPSLMETLINNVLNIQIIKSICPDKITPNMEFNTKNLIKVIFPNVMETSIGSL